MSRLSIELTDQQHQQIKARAALQGQSIKDYALTRLFPMSADEERAITELGLLLVPRIEGGLQGREISGQGFDEIVQEALNGTAPA